MATPLIQKLYIRQRIWLLLLCSTVALVCISAITILKAQQQYSDLKAEQYERVVGVAARNIEFFYQEFEEGRITEVQAKQAAKSSLRKMSLDAHNVFFIHNAESTLMVFHPTLISYNDDTEIAHTFSKNFEKTRTKNMTEKFGILESGLNSGAIFLETYPTRESGLIEYWFYELGEQKYPFVSRVDSEKPVESATRIAAYGRHFSPWNWIIFTGVDLDEEQESFSSWLSYLLSAAGIAIFILLFFGYWISTSISKPLQSITTLMSDISSGSGNLSERLSATGRNELTLFSNGFNTFVERISDIVQKVSRTTQSVSSHSSDLSRSMERTVSQANEQLAETEMLASATNELSYSLKSVAERAQNSSKAAKSAQEASDQSAEVISRNIKAINALTDALLNTQAEVENMETFSNKVSSVLEVIVGVAEQTNLLALNAAIEAARAGEQGRGFAVVADEVRTLARRTQNSTAEIHTIIENLQSGTQRVVHSMIDGLKNSEICATTATESNQVLIQVKAYVEEISKMNIDISAAVDQQSITTQEIAGSSQKIAENSKRTLNDNEKNQQSNQSMSTQVQEMDALVKQFKID